MGFGRLGRACAQALGEAPDLLPAGVVRRPESAGRLPQPFSGIPAVAHLRDLAGVDAALLCVPPAVSSAAARDVLQLGIPLVECAALEGRSLVAHHETIARAASAHRVAAVVGAGWDPGMLTLMRRAFEVLVPKGETIATASPGVSLHHTEAARNAPGVVGALATEHRDAGGKVTHYIYAQLQSGADPARVQAALDADPLFAGERALLFPVESISTLEQEGHGLVLERRGTARSGAHQSLLLEGRFDAAIFAARVMLDAARGLPRLGPGAHRYCLRSG